MRSIGYNKRFFETPHEENKMASGLIVCIELNETPNDPQTGRSHIE
ncbi:hypothetical protein SV7mr_34740 [Stieleria bergensis]|uniref:Uncharacterized protein n=1 Tax=Stieleria bergensis TaxID=2528025 RepID=A0A517SXS2_9BACT|nr:hypothetical protein SV7mr_34740 [Planctomycetes bacterium SV_7m_r]